MGKTLGRVWSRSQFVQILHSFTMGILFQFIMASHLIPRVYATVVLRRHHKMSDGPDY